MPNKRPMRYSTPAADEISRSEPPAAEATSPVHDRWESPPSSPPRGDPAAAGNAEVFTPHPCTTSPSASGEYVNTRPRRR
ncbi:hypothetical protein JYU34_001356 [Plutella xylostella]|uniref:Uncharacterized protein n=2 Tax=Plutella xylostella TaxID=51655 RepID=A0ABQ7R3Q2_PLUXY|nr:hypothetical protein JYU34_001356 [Plutella xylostella]